MRRQTFRSFSGKSFRDFQKDCAMEMHNEIEDKGKDYILSVEEEEYKKYLKEKYWIQPLKIIEGSEEILPPIKVKINREEPYRGNTYEIEVYECTVKYYFKGAPKLFELKSNPWTITSYEISINPINNSVSFTFMIDKQDPELFNKRKVETYQSAFANLKNLNLEVDSWNTSLNDLVSDTFYKHKQKLINENSFFEAINVKVDQKTESVFSVPTIQKKVIPQPKTQKKEFTSEPAMNTEMYQDTLKVIYDFGRSMERKPSLYKGKNEEDIRDLFVAIMETRYDNTTATGETFNKGGKTDILLKYQDGSNLFVAECKWWKGESEFHSAINQLFDNYLTWRDSKTALLFFVKNKEITAVCEKIKLEASIHPYYLSTTKDSEEGRFSFKFHLPDDKNKEVYLEIMAFHFN